MAKIKTLLSDKTFVIKWTASVLQIFGYALTGLDITPLNSYVFLIGIIGWCMVGVLWNDKAIILLHIIAFGVLASGLLSKV